MATYGFLDVLEEELDKNFPFDFEISWDKRNHAVEGGQNGNIRIFRCFRGRVGQELSL
ncbi:Protein of uncharacterised function (DUF3013) [Streptococcus pneumoniae]|nr:Protein of uncharacterised function (DUF3013) [Streptococcus pneumoniae]